MAQKKKSKKNEKLGVGSIIALIIAGLLLVAVLVGVIFYVHSGKAGVSESAGLITANNTTVVEQATEAEEVTAADTEEETVIVSKTDKDGNIVTSVSKKTAEKATKSDASTPKDKDTASADIVFKNKVSAKQLGKFYDADVDTFRKAYDGKTATVTGKVSGKSPKMLYVELDTGTKVPLRIYLNSEEQRDKFNLLEEGKSISVKGTFAILYPEEMDAGGFQEMANGLIALNNVSLVK